MDKLYEGSADVSRICDELINHFRNLMIASCTKDASAILKSLPGEMLRIEKQSKAFSQPEIFYAISVLQDTLVKMSKSASKRLEFELALVKLCSPELSNGTEALLARIERLESEIALLKARGVAPAEKTPAKEPEKAFEEPKEVYAEVPAEEPKAVSAPFESGAESEFAPWEDIIELIRKKNGMLFSLLSGSKAYLSGKRVLIDSPNSFFSRSCWLSSSAL